jgi:hypothetical protein
VGSSARTVIPFATQKNTTVICALKKLFPTSVDLISTTYTWITKVNIKASGTASKLVSQMSAGKSKTIPFTPLNVFVFPPIAPYTANKKLKTSPFIRPFTNAPGAILERVS